MITEEARRAKQAQRDYDEGLVTKEELDYAVHLAELVERVTQEHQPEESWQRKAVKVLRKWDESCDESLASDLAKVVRDALIECRNEKGAN